MTKLLQQCKECRVIFVSPPNKHWCPGKVETSNPPWQGIILPLFCCFMQSGYIWDCKKCEVMIGDPNKHWNIFHCNQQSDDKFLENMSVKETNSRIEELKNKNKKIKTSHDNLVRRLKVYCAQNCEFHNPAIMLLKKLC